MGRVYVSSRNVKSCRIVYGIARCPFPYIARQELSIKIGYAVCNG